MRFVRWRRSGLLFLQRRFSHVGNAYVVCYLLADELCFFLFPYGNGHRPQTFGAAGTRADRLSRVSVSKVMHTEDVNVDFCEPAVLPCRFKCPC